MRRRFKADIGRPRRCAVTLAGAAALTLGTVTNGNGQSVRPDDGPAIRRSVVAAPVQAFTPGSVRDPRIRPLWVRAAAADALPQSARADAWIAADKFRHFFTSYSATAMTFGAARLAGLARDESLAAAAAAAALAGLAKEFDDVRRGSFFSARDIVWDALGIASALAVLRSTR